MDYWRTKPPSSTLQSPPLQCYLSQVSYARRHTKESGRAHLTPGSALIGNGDYWKALKAIHAAKTQDVIR